MAHGIIVGKVCPVIFGLLDYRSIEWGGLGWGGDDLISQVSLVLKCRLHFQMLPGSFLPSKNTQRVSLKWLVLNDDDAFGPFRSPKCKKFGVIGVSFWFKGAPGGADQSLQVSRVSYQRKIIPF